MSITLAPALLAPPAALVIWSLIMLLWLAAVRGRSFKAAKLDLRKVPPGGRGQDLEKILPPAANWPAHNYAHLMEQPTLFYATVLILALLGQGSPLNLGLAWGYVGLRIVHSIYQVKVNFVPVRAGIFFLATILLIIMAINALSAAMALS